MQQVYINSLFDFTPVICGRKLLPLSLGHSLILDIIGSPFATGGDVGFDSVISLIWVCSKPFNEAVKAIENWDETVKEITEWGKEVGSGLDLGTVAPVIRDYLTHYQSSPAVWEKQIDADFGEGGKPRQVKRAVVPWQWMVAFRLLGKFPEAEIWNMPLCKAIVWQACFLDSQGESNLMPQEAVEMMDGAEAGEAVQTAPDGQAEGKAGHVEEEVSNGC